MTRDDRTVTQRDQTPPWCTPWLLATSDNNIYAAGCWLLGAGERKRCPLLYLAILTPGSLAEFCHAASGHSSHSSCGGVAMLWWWSTQHCCCGELEGTAVAVLLLVVVVVVRTFELLGASQLDAGQRSGEQLRGDSWAQGGGEATTPQHHTQQHNITQHYTLHNTTTLYTTQHCSPG